MDLSKLGSYKKQLFPFCGNVSSKLTKRAFRSIRKISFFKILPSLAACEILYRLLTDSAKIELPIIFH